MARKRRAVASKEEADPSPPFAKGATEFGMTRGSGERRDWESYDLGPQEKVKIPTRKPRVWGTRDGWGGKKKQILRCAQNDKFGMNARVTGLTRRIRNAGWRTYGALDFLC